MTPESDLGIIAACDKRYEHYVPLFILSATQAYPDATVYVFLHGEAEVRTRELLSRIEGNFYFHDNCFPKVNSVLAAKAMRWLIYLTEFADHKYIYIGDIDLMICHEPAGIVLPHVYHCELLGLPYSTKMRAHQDRVSALVFAYREQWYDAMRPVVHDFAPRIWAGEYDEIKSDEKLLYKMISSSSLPLPPTVQERDDSPARYHPHHGLHFTIFKDADRLNWRLGQPQYRFLKTDYPQYWKAFKDRVQSHPAYESIVDCGDLRATIARIYPALRISEVLG